MTLQNKHYNFYNSFVLIFFISALSSSCTKVSPSPDPKAQLMGSHRDKAPTLIIMPFENATDEKDLDKLIRKSLAEHPCIKNYYALPVDEVDHALGQFERSLEEKWQDFSPRTLGKLFHCNYLLYGEVYTFQKRFWGLYAQASLGVQVKLVETELGTTLWTATVIKRAYEGGLPFSFFNILPEFLRCSAEIKQETKHSLIPNLSHELCDKMPKPPQSGLSVFILAIQIASFAEKKLALNTIKELASHGFDARIEKVMLPTGAWYRIIMGPFYDQQEALMSRRRIEKDQRFYPVFIYY